MVHDEKSKEAQQRRGHEEHRHDLYSLKDSLYVEQEVSEKHRHQEHYGESVGCKEIVANDEADEEGEQEQQLLV